MCRRMKPLSPLTPFVRRRRDRAEPDYRHWWLRAQAEADALRQRLDNIRTTLECEYPYDEFACIHLLKAELAYHAGPNRYREIIEEMKREAGCIGGSKQHERDR